MARRARPNLRIFPKRRLSSMDNCWLTALRWIPTGRSWRRRGRSRAVIDSPEGRMCRAYGVCVFSFFAIIAIQDSGRRNADEGFVIPNREAERNLLLLMADC